MEKLQYDSFYKFLVSLGTILITAPLIALYYLINIGNGIFIETDVYNALTHSSQEILDKRESIMYFVLKYCPFFLAFLMLLGILALVYGGRKWFELQKEFDKQIKLKTQEQENIVEKMSTPEVLKRTNEDVQETKPNSSTESTARGSILRKAIDLEEAYYMQLKKELRKDYFLEQNVKIHQVEYDIIAKSKLNNIDLLYELKYWTQVPTQKKFQEILKKLDKRGEFYENTMHRNFHNYLVVFTSKSNVSKMKRIVFSEASQIGLNKRIEIEVCSEDEIEKFH